MSGVCRPSNLVDAECFFFNSYVDFGSENLVLAFMDKTEGRKWAFIWCFTQRIIKKKREEGGEKGGKEGEKRREKREGRVKGELPQVITTANQSGKGCWDSSVF